MTSRREATLLAIVLALATSVIYLWRLHDAPIYLLREEAFLGVVGHSLASTARDLEGQLRPFYVYSPAHGTYWAPILPYAIAGVLKVLPLSEGVVRAPMAAAAVLNVVLVFFIGRLVFACRHTALIPAALLALAPAQIIENRYANDPGVPATFALAWMLAFLIYVRVAKSTWLFVAGLVLGVGAYSYVAAAALMPLYLALTAVTLWRHREPLGRDVTLIVAFVIPIAIGLPWFIRHPEAFRITFLHYQSSQFRSADAWTSLATVAAVTRAARAALLYLQFWNPRFLFIDGAPSLMHSTGRAGVFLVSMSGLLVVGIVSTARRAWSDHRALLVLGAFLLAPLPTTFVDVNDHAALYAIWRAMEIVSLGALLAGFGVEYVMTSTRSPSRVLAVAGVFGIPLALVAVYGNHGPHPQAMLRAFVVAAAIGGSGVLLPAIARGSRRRINGGSAAGVALMALGVISLVEFRDFYSDYMTKYQDRYVVHTDGTVGDALESAIARTPAVAPSQLRPAPTIYLVLRLGPAEWSTYYWRFYVHKHQREDLLARTFDDVDAHGFTHDQICQFPPGSLIVTPLGWNEADTLATRMIKNGELMLEVFVRNRAGDPTHWLLRTSGACGPA